MNVIYPNRWQRNAEPLAISSKLTPLIFSEIHPHPPTRVDAKNVEFLELYNTNPSPEDLTGWRIWAMWISPFQQEPAFLLKAS